MKIFDHEIHAEKKEGGAIHMMKEHRGPARHLPPHERKAFFHISFDEDDWEILRKIFGDEDTAAAAAEIMRCAPPEIQILAVQLMNIIEEVA